MCDKEMDGFGVFELVLQLFFWVSEMFNRNESDQTLPIKRSIQMELMKCSQSIIDVSRGVVIIK